MNGEGSCKVCVAQLGARRHYAVPRALNEHGRLRQFYTDIYLGQGWMHQVVERVARFSGAKALQRFAGRQGTTLPPDMVKSFPMFGLEYKFRARSASIVTQRTATWMWGGRRFCQLVANKITAECDAVYAYTSAAKELFERARQLGAFTCLDHATAPRRTEMALVHEEWERFPDWVLKGEQDQLIDAYHERQREELVLADRVICGSNFARDMVLNEGIDPLKIRVVPLGISIPLYHFDRAERKTATELHVLFVGGNGLLKGIGYLGQARQRLRSKHIHVRVAGDLEISSTGLTEIGRHLELLGPVPRTEITALLQWADVLVLPSISDTFGLVVLEAMAEGLPVIATPHTCGPDVIREGMDGFIVPIRDSDAIADRLDSLASNRALLLDMSRNALARVREFSIERYGERLVEATTPQLAASRVE